MQRHLRMVMMMEKVVDVGVQWVVFLSLFSLLAP